MTTIKTADLTPLQVNALVAKAEGRDPLRPPMYCSEDDDMAGLIIDREHIATAWMGEAEGWAAFNLRPTNNPSGYDGSGYIDVSTADIDGQAATRSEAAMRAHVRKVYGDTITTDNMPWMMDPSAS